MFDVSQEFSLITNPSGQSPLSDPHIQIKHFASDRVVYKCERCVSVSGVYVSSL